MREIVTHPDQVVENIHRFDEELAGSHGLQQRLGQVRAWYAVRGEGGRWIFGPSKFVGYKGNSTEEYLKTYRTDAHGGETELVLRQWFSSVDPESRLGTELMGALTEFLARWGRKPNKKARISVVADEPRLAEATRGEADHLLLARISSDPAICGGRPCIKGTRMRVSDIVDMTAHGASREEILADFPYLSAEDVQAALVYAARAADHRVIRAA